MPSQLDFKNRAFFLYGTSEDVLHLEEAKKYGVEFTRKKRGVYTSSNNQKNNKTYILELFYTK